MTIGLGMLSLQYIIFYCYCQVSIVLESQTARSITLIEFCRFRAVVLGAAHVFLFDQDGRLMRTEAARVPHSGALWHWVVTRRLATTPRLMNHALGTLACNA